MRVVVRVDMCDGYTHAFITPLSVVLSAPHTSLRVCLYPPCRSQSQVPRRTLVRCARPARPERAPWEPPEQRGGLAPKDVVAVHAQISPAATLSALLDALRNDHRDDGIEALYTFASLDIWSVKHRFFGRVMDLGQFERFKRVVTASPYNALLRHTRRNVLAALTLDADTYVARVQFDVPRRDPVVLVFRLCRRAIAVDAQHRPPPSWMVDSILAAESLE